MDVILGIADHFVDTADYEKKYICKYKVIVECEKEQIVYIENEFFDVNYMSYYKTVTLAENVEKIRKDKGLEIGQKLDVLNNLIICPEGEAKSRRNGKQRIENEPNDSFSSADIIEDDDNMLGWIGESGDEDYYEIEFSRDGLVNFWIGNIPDHEDYDIYVYDDDDKDDLVYSGNEEGNGDSEEISCVPIEGDRTYYIKVEGNKRNDYDSQSNYTLRAKWKEKVDEDDYEDNDDFDEAQSIFILENDDDSNKETINANLHNSYDEDYYLIELESDASVKITLKDIPEYCDYDLKLYDDNEDKLAFSTNNDDDDECIKMDLKKGDYYVRVYGGFSDEEYELTVEANAENNEYGDEFEPNNDVDEAENILVFNKNDSNKEKTIKATLHNDDDDDYYLIKLDKEADIEITLENIPRFSDYNLKLYDHNEDEVARSTNENHEDEKIEERLEKGDYYIKVYKDYSNEEYELTVKATSIISGNDIIQADGKWFKIKNPENVQEMMSDSPRIDLKDKDIFVKAVESKYEERQVVVCDDGEFQGQLYAGTGSNWSESGNQVVAIPTNSMAVASNIRTRGFFDGDKSIDIEKVVDDFFDGLLHEFGLERSDFTEENLDSFLAGTAYGVDQNIAFGWIAWATGAKERDDDYFFMLAKTGSDIFSLGLFAEAGAILGSIAAAGTSIGSGMIAFGITASPAGGCSLSISGAGIVVSEAAAASAIGVVGLSCMAARTSDLLEKDMSKLHKMESELREGMENLSDSIGDKVLKQIKKKWGEKGVEAFKKAADKGIVGAKNQNGIKVLKGGGIKIGGQNYTHEIKVLNKEYGDYRIFGYLDDAGKFVFDQFKKGLH